MRIVKAETKDADEISQLTISSKAYWNYSPEQLEEWRDELTITPKFIDENEVYKLVKNNTLVGFYAYQPLNKQDVKLSFLFIAPEFVGQGYGNRLMLHFLKQIDKIQFKKVLLDADPNAEGFYARFGFRVIGKLKSTIKNRFLPVMEKTMHPL